MSKEEQKRIIAENIRNFLEEKDISQKHFATKLAYISESDLSKILHEKRVTQPDELKRIANAMHCDVDYLIGKRVERTKENTDIMALLPLDEEAVEVLQDLKIDCEISKEAQFIADLISFFIKALYSDTCGEDSAMFIRSLNGMCDMHNDPLWKSKFWESFEPEQRRDQLYYLAYKEELRESITRIMTEFCKTHPSISQTMIMDLQLDDTLDSFYREVEENGNI